MNNGVPSHMFPGCGLLISLSNRLFQKTCSLIKMGKATYSELRTHGHCSEESNIHSLVHTSSIDGCSTYGI